jgi:hypothetical protein
VLSERATQYGNLRKVAPVPQSDLCNEQRKTLRRMDANGNKAAARC